MIRSGEVFIQRKMFLYNTRAQSHGRKRHFNAECVIGIAHVNVEL